MNSAKPVADVFKTKIVSIDFAPAGDRMDLAVAEKVMGWRPVGFCRSRDMFYTTADDDLSKAVDLPYFSTLRLPALEIVDHMTARGWGVRLSDTSGFGDVWWAELFYDGTTYTGFGLSEDGVVIQCSLPLAICRAALKACGVTELEIPDD